MRSVLLSHTLVQGVHQLNWNDFGITEFVQEASSVVVGVETVLKTLKASWLGLA